MKITPKTEQEFTSRNLMDPGIYDFVVSGATEKVSKTSGDPMIEVVLKVTDINGRVHTIFDYLIDKEPIDFKIRHICDCAGLISKYESGEINAHDLLDKKGKVKVIIRKDKTGQYGDKNAVQDYIYEKNTIQSDFLDDEKIPF